MEMSEEGVHSANLIEAHLVNQLLENQGIIGKQIHAPFPVIKPDRTGDDLFDLPSVTAANQTVIVHLARALFNGQRVPVFAFTAAAVHGIKRYIAALGQFWK